MAWPAPLPGRLLEAVGNRGPRGVTVAGRKLRTEPGLQASFANFTPLPVVARAMPRSPSVFTDLGQVGIRDHIAASRGCWVGRAPVFFPKCAAQRLTSTLTELEISP